MALKRYCDETDIIYSAWHRPDSIKRFVKNVDVNSISMIDIDDIKIWIEYEDDSKERWPIGLIETAHDTGKEKVFTVTKNMAKLCGLPAMCVLYKKSVESNPADKNVNDIESFRVKRIYPKMDFQWQVLGPKKYASLLLNMRSVGLEMLHKRLTELF